ncbi:hypothetical protein Pan241w_26420 [Gimesia alba]|uniref:Uncharacterized protein n=1 Tax=Gimesia alba TaxID=2527973 RepID=A0A517RFA2_9PLAN|nr:hypothetical protein [Gimesia alba]QDT42557.1 hypothetical protein Pan241w_26420 [Gimesia alba]
MSKKQSQLISRPFTAETIAQLLQGMNLPQHPGTQPRFVPTNVAQNIPEDIEIIDLDSQRDESVKPWVFG